MFTEQKKFTLKLKINVCIMGIDPLIYKQKCVDEWEENCAEKIKIMGEIIFVRFLLACFLTSFSAG